MIFIQMNAHSAALRENVSFNVLLPEQSADAGGGAPEHYKTLYLLHGLSGNHADWIRKTCIERYAAEHQIAVVMPEVGRSWYTDTAYKAGYLTFISEELPRICRNCFRGMSDKREDNMVGGMSMGGYGALKVALTHPESFGYCFSLSGALDITRDGRTYMLEEWQANFGFALQDAKELKGSCHDIFALAQHNKDAGVPFPKLFMWCGTGDSLIIPNDRFHEHLVNLNVAHQYEFSEGNHTWKWWDMHAENALNYLLKD